MIDRLAKQVQHLQAQQVTDVVHVGMAGGDNHRQVLAGSVLAQALDQGNATFFRHAQVGNHQSHIRVAGELLQGEFDRGGGVATEAFALKQFGQFQQGVLFIIHEENLLTLGRGWHGVTPLEFKGQAVKPIKLVSL
ncbi:hypothetical protein D3C77_540620 [compost metagenome]